MSIERAIVNFYELPTEWQKEALSNFNSEEEAQEASYLMPLEEHNPSEHILWDLSEAMRQEPVGMCEYDAIIGVSNNSAIGLKISACGESCVMHFL